MEHTVRKAACAGGFYPGEPDAIRNLITRITQVEREKISFDLASKNIIGGIVPHAGFVYSGYEAVHFYEILAKSEKPFETIVIVNPNHSGMGNGPFNTCGFRFWETPLGMVETDEAFAEATRLLPYYPAHIREHSGEVQLPFLQHYLLNAWKVVMITMNTQTPAAANELAKQIQNAVFITGRKIILIASSDFCHFETPSAGFKKDQYVIDQILDLDVEGVYHEVKKHEVSACGYGPIMTLISYANSFAPGSKMQLLRRGHSGEVSPSDKVVDYASFLCFTD